MPPALPCLRDLWNAEPLTFKRGHPRGAGARRSGRDAEAVEEQVQLGGIVVVEIRVGGQGAVARTGQDGLEGGKQAARVIRQVGFLRQFGKFSGGLGGMAVRNGLSDGRAKLTANASSNGLAPRWLSAFRRVEEHGSESGGG